MNNFEINIGINAKAQGKKQFSAPSRFWAQCGFFLLFFIASFFAFTPIVNAQKVSLDVTDENLEDVLLNFAADHGFEVIFNAAYFENKTLSINLSNQPIRKALEQILKNTKVDFSIVEQTIFLTKRKRIYGYLIDEKTGEKLINGAVFHIESSSGAYTNEHGFFSFEVPFETKTCGASYTGYKVKDLELPLQSSIFLNIELAPEAYLSEVVILSSQNSDDNAAAFRLGKGEELLTNKINSYVASGGVPDVFQFLYKKPGVAAGPDGLGGLHVRGGNTDQNLILYDGVKVYNPSHAFGLFSIFNPNLLQHAKFQKSNFHPRNGGRISSVVDLRLKEGSVRNWNGGVSVSNLATEATLDGPLIKDKTGLMLGFRRSHIDNFIKSYSSQRKEDFYEDEFETWDDSGETNYFLYDFNAKLHHRINKNHRIFLSAYGGQDSFRDELNQYYDSPEFSYDDSLKFDLKWGNRIYSLRWNHLWSDRLFSNFTVSASDFKSQSISDRSLYTFEEFDGTFWEDEENYLTFFNSKITDRGVDYDFDYFLGKRHHFTFGVGFHRVNYEPGTAQISGETLLPEFEEEDFIYFEEVDDLFENAFQSNELHFYVNEDFSLSKKIRLTAGGRFALFQSEDFFNDLTSNFLLFQPRFAIEYRSSPQFSTLLSAERIQQPVHLLTTSEFNFPNDLWIPSFESIKPQTANQFNLTAEYSKNDRFKITSSAYYKSFSNLLRYRDGSSLPSLEADATINYDWEENLISGTGNSTGFEVETEYQTDNFRGNIAYTYSISNRQFSEVNGGESFPFRFDLQHAISANIYQKITNKVWGYANWQFSSGLPQTIYYDDSGGYNPIDPFSIQPTEQISDINGVRLKEYHRLDVGILATFKKKKFTHDLNLGVQNVYQRKNIWYTTREYNWETGRDDFRNKNALPLLPVLRYKISFSE